MKACRDCRNQVSEDAFLCPRCGCPYPAKENWTGWGFEYKSEAALAGWPLIHISFKYRPNRAPIVARGVIAIGQFAVGFVTIAQFGIGVFCLAQFALAAFAVAQFAVAYSLIAQFGAFLGAARGMFLIDLTSFTRVF